ncbi:lipid scramblase CLPTM1L-like [Tubulanus polymorphus]|uniref:lipid scramblase CLPTM1L-like n=1 Tax=Tubulanus polymorphus TaxID=672921 RepID=UPI003DA5526C
MLRSLSLFSDIKMWRPSLTTILSTLFLLYISHSMYSIYSLFHPTQCQIQSTCLKPYLSRNKPLQLSIYSSKSEQVRSIDDLTLIWRIMDFTASKSIDHTLNVTVPKKTRNNGTLFLHIFLHPLNQLSFKNRYTVYTSGVLTTYSVKKAETFNLMGEQKVKNESKPFDSRPVSHWKTEIFINVMDELISLDRYQVPPLLYKFVRLSPENEYLPPLYLDTVSERDRHLQALNKTCYEMPLTIHYTPTSVGRLQLWSSLEESMKMLYSFGFSQKDTDEVKGIFADTNIYLLLLTFLVSACHLLFDFLAFKNDINFWRNRDSMVGLSTRVVIWRCMSMIIIFFYLKDEDTSLLVLGPAGIGALIEMWKVSKAFKVKVIRRGFMPSFQIGSTSAGEAETEKIDSQAMKYLSYVLYPLLICGAIYSLLYNPFKSWYSWCLHSMVNGVYAFGFLFMLPQLFLNYKLKSVAHLPWRAFMYKAFNTFIDDIFAFIITMPTAHRLACFRDDIIFVIYLYQRWLYPVDKKRVNEYGQSFVENDTKQSKNDKKDK